MQLPNIFSPTAQASTRDEIEMLSAEFESLRSAESDRLSRYKEYQDEIEYSRSVPSSLMTKDYGQSNAAAKPSRHDIPLPFAQVLTVKHTHRVSGRLPEAIVYRREETPSERYRSDTMEKMFWGIVRHSKGESQFSSGSWDASKFGAACFEVYWNAKMQMPHFRTLDPGGVLVVRGMDDPHDFKRFYRFWEVPAETIRAEYRNATFRGEPVRVSDITGIGDREMVTIVQVSDKNSTIRFAMGMKPVPLYELVHNYGMVPYVVIPNLGPDRAVWGWADYEFIRGIAEYLPKLFSRQADILRAIAGGAYKDKKSGQPPQKIASWLADGGVLPVGANGDIEPVAAPVMPPMAVEHSADALRFLKMLGFTPDAGWGEGASTSGSDRTLQNQPSLELAALKRINWATGLSRLAKMCYEMIEKMQVDNARYSGTVVKGAQRKPFNFTLGADPNATAQVAPNPGFDPMDPMSQEDFEIPRTAKELFDGEHEICFSWLNRVDPDDPAFVMSELNKFGQAVQSLRTTLERTGCDNPEDEMKLIEQEAERFPWLRQGQIALTKAQLDAQNQGGGGQGAGGGPPVDPATGLDQAMAAMSTKDGTAQDVNAGSTGLNSDVSGPLYGG